MKKVIRLEDIIEGRGEVKGFLFTKVYETEKGYVYKVEDGNYIHYESFYKKEVPVCIDFEKRIYSETEKKEVYPRSNDFGVWAWSTGNLERAIKRILQDN